jgi:cysteine desulfurase
VIYLDHAATTPLSAAVLDAMLPYLRERFGNASEPHAHGRAARAGLDAARAEVGDALGALATDVVFTGSGTEADNIAVAGRLAGGGRVVASAIEHPAVRERLLAYAASGGAVAWVPVDGDGVLDLAALEALVRPDDALCAVMWANNVTGAVQPIAGVAAVCRERRVPLHVDAVQAATALPIDAGMLGEAGTLAVAAHKLGGPKGVGALVGRGLRSLAPTVFGGGQEGGLRPGTEDVAGAVGLATALAARSLDPARARLRDRLEAELGLPVAAAGAPRLPGHACLLTGVRGDTLVRLLDEEGFSVAAGSACASGDAAPSHVLVAMGIDDHVARGALRVTLGPSTTAAEVAAFASAFRRLHGELARAAAAVA